MDPKRKVYSEQTYYGKCRLIYRQDGLSGGEERVGELFHGDGHDVVCDTDGNRLGTLRHGRVYDDNGFYVGDIRDERCSPITPERDVVRDRDGNRFSTEVELLQQANTPAPRSAPSGGGGGGGGGCGCGGMGLIFFIGFVMVLVREGPDMIKGGIASFQKKRAEAAHWEIVEATSPRPLFFDYAKLAPFEVPIMRARNISLREEPLTKDHPCSYLYSISRLNEKNYEDESNVSTTDRKEWENLAACLRMVEEGYSTRSWLTIDFLRREGFKELQKGDVLGGLECYLMDDRYHGSAEYDANKKQQFWAGAHNFLYGHNLLGEKYTLAYKLMILNDAGSIALYWGREDYARIAFSIPQPSWDNGRQFSPEEKKWSDSLKTHLDALGPAPLPWESAPEPEEEPGLTHSTPLILKDGEVEEGAPISPKAPRPARPLRPAWLRVVEMRLTGIKEMMVSVERDGASEGLAVPPNANLEFPKDAVETCFILEDFRSEDKATIYRIRPRAGRTYVKVRINERATSR